MSADAMQTPGPILATAPVLSDATTSPHTLALLLFVLAPRCSCSSRGGSGTAPRASASR